MNTKRYNKATKFFTVYEFITGMHSDDSHRKVKSIRVLPEELYKLIPLYLEYRGLDFTATKLLVSSMQDDNPKLVALLEIGHINMPDNMEEIFNYHVTGRVDDSMIYEIKMGNLLPVYLTIETKHDDTVTHLLQKKGFDIKWQGDAVVIATWKGGV